MQTFHKENGSELNEKLNVYCIGIDSRIYYCNNRYTCVYIYIYNKIKYSEHTPTPTHSPTVPLGNIILIPSQPVFALSP
jgi:hypothetical protein